ncbi:MAG: ATP-dependent DNA helicase RecG [Thermoanaerobaculia bacterium]
MTPAARLEPSSPLRFVPGIGPQRAAQLAEAGYHTVLDLLFHLPLRYEDRRRVVAVAEVTAPGTWTVRGRLAELRLVRTRRRRFSIVRGRLVDGGAALPLVWFNQPYLMQRLHDGDEVFLHGAVRGTESLLLEMINPTCERAEAQAATGAIVPIYPSLAQSGPALARRWVSAALAAIAPADTLPDPLPAELRRRYSLPRLREALLELHRPSAAAEIEALDAASTPAHFRLVYGEFLELQLEMALLRSREVSVPKKHAYRIDDRTRAAARAALPFRLTAAQKRVLAEIVAELRRPEPMLRLLQGDVGSGKTILAALCLLIAAESGLQGAFMAPTELLAEQHFANLEKILGSRYRLVLVSGSAGERSAARRALASGEAPIAVGTHALIQEDVRFSRLGLAVIDEQHRFGVEQRRLLARKGDRPDILVMTATPIPRSLALVAYGDLETSELDELPPGRIPVATEVAPLGSRTQVYRRLRAALAAGAQAYVVFPLIEESEEISAGAVTALGEKVRRYLADSPSAILHGRLPAAERERIMSAFARGEIRVLLATTVIEVGVDVPAATWMIIESAERFGLAQLHQLRGRVGRGREPGCCVALHGRLSEDGKRRLEVFASTTDGFRIAEADLELRGPGDLLGTRQAGLPRFQVASLLAHRSWLERARADAREILPRLGERQFAALAARVEPRAASRYERFAGG